MRPIHGWYTSENLETPSRLSRPGDDFRGLLGVAPERQQQDDERGEQQTPRLRPGQRVQSAIAQPAQSSVSAGLRRTCGV